MCDWLVVRHAVGQETQLDWADEDLWQWIFVDLHLSTTDRQRQGSDRAAATRVG